MCFEQLGGRKDDFMSKTHLTSDLFGYGPFPMQLAGQIFAFLEFLSFYIYIRPEDSESLLGGRPFVDCREVHATERRDGSDPKLLAEGRAARPFIHVHIRRNSHNQDIPHPLGCLKMLYVPRMHKVEASVTQDNFLTRPFHPLQVPGQIVGVDDCSHFLSPNH